MPNMPVTLDTSHFDRSPLKDDASVNMRCILVTLDTSHFERSPSNLLALGTGIPFELANKLSMSLTAETSQDPIGWCGPLEQSMDIFRHSLMAAWSSLLDLRVNPGLGVTMGQTLGFSTRVTMMIRIRGWVRGLEIGVE